MFVVSLTLTFSGDRARLRERERERERESERERERERHIVPGPLRGVGGLKYLGLGYLVLASLTVGAPSPWRPLKKEEWRSKHVS